MRKQEAKENNQVVFSRMQRCRSFAGIQADLDSQPEVLCDYNTYPFNNWGAGFF